MTIQEKQEKLFLIPDQKMNLENKQKLAQIFSQIAKTNYQKVIIDFKNVKYIDCYALDKLLSLQKKLQKRDSELIITNLNYSFVKRFFELVDVEKIIPIKKQNYS
ncbi:STAS domain-containing protein [Fuchsiella alkaliacetigena]|uniref:STAS domain-containing protein n=1 Tax=Fuchsiella alkaliacetigena TaxID=957042 RepID=UPI00200A314B|nr:STAS domain-containing protein [Fuchsiella alkaliacetigena]MCK8824019.1 STAS domain-containing protein [Fuchsiella alkaliacetigena]